VNGLKGKEKVTMKTIEKKLRNELSQLKKILEEAKKRL